MKDTKEISKITRTRHSLVSQLQQATGYYSLAIRRVRGITKLGQNKLWGIQPNFVIILLILTIFLLFAVHFKHDTQNTDLWIHLNEGKAIYENKALATYDTFTYTRQGTKASMHEWLYQVILYFLYIKIGLTGLLVVNTIGIVLMLGIVFYYLKDSFYFALLATILLSYLILISSTIRPQIISFLFLTILFILIERKKEWFLPALFLIWGNIHPLHLLGLLIMAIYFSKKYFITKNKKYVWVMGISIIAAAINPEGIKTFFIPFTISYPHIYEWSPLSPEGNYFWIFTGMVLLGIYSFFREKTFKNSFKIEDFLVFVLLIYLGYHARRHVAQFFILGILIISNNFRDIREKEIFSVQTKKKNLVCIFAIILLLLICVQIQERFTAAFDWSALPKTETEIIKTYQLKGNMFNDYGYGGFLEFFLYPENLMYIDSRAETMGEKLLDEYYSLGTKKKSDIFKVLNRDNVTIVIIKHTMGITNLLLNNPDWKLIYVDGTRASFVQRTNETENIPEVDLSKNEYVI